MYIYVYMCSMCAKCMRTTAVSGTASTMPARDRGGSTGYIDHIIYYGYRDMCVWVHIHIYYMQI